MPLVTILLPGGSGYAVDFSPLFRSTIGFDRLFDVSPSVQRVGEESYPPYNIERLDENRFQISVALAGFRPDEVELTVEQNVLTLEGRKSDKEGKTFLHRGISARNFKRQFTLADHVEVKGARVRERPARHRPAAGNPRGDEAPPHRDQRRYPEQRHPDRSPKPPDRTRATWIDRRRAGFPARPPSTRLRFGGSHAADDRP